MKKNLFEWLYENEHYEINPHMIREIFKFYKLESNIIEQLDFCNYTTIKNLPNKELVPLKNYIEDNIELYLEQVVFKIENNKEETIASIALLLNNKKVSEENKKKIVQQKKGIAVENIEIVVDNNLWRMLIENFKVSPTWENILNYYEKVNEEDQNNKGLDETIVKYLNDEESVLKLPKQSKEISENEIMEEMIADIIKEKKISDITYEEIIIKLYNAVELNLEEISEKKLEIVIENEKLVFNIGEETVSYNKKRINQIKQRGFKSWIKYIFLNINSFIEFQNEYEMEESDYCELLTSELELSDKKRIISNLDIIKLSDESNILNIITNILIENNIIKLEEKEIAKILNSEKISLETKQIFIRKLDPNIFIEKLSDIEDEKLYNDLLNNRSIDISWENIITYYKKKKLTDYSQLDEAIVKWYNDGAIVKKLIESNLGTEKEVNSIIYGTITYENRIKDNLYIDLLKKLNDSWDSLFQEKINLKRLKLLIENEQLNLTQESIKMLKNSDLWLLLIRIKIEDFIKNMEKLAIESEEYLIILNDFNITINEKIKIIENIDNNYLEQDNVLVMKSLQLIVENVKLVTLSEEKIMILLKTNDKKIRKLKIKFLISQMKENDLENLKKYLEAIGEDRYSDILNNNEECEGLKGQEKIFYNKLKELGYKK